MPWLVFSSGKKALLMMKKVPQGVPAVHYSTPQPSLFEMDIYLQTVDT